MDTHLLACHWLSVHNGVDLTWTTDLAIGAPRVFGNLGRAGLRQSEPV